MSHVKCMPRLLKFLLFFFIIHIFAISVFLSTPVPRHNAPRETWVTSDIDSSGNLLYPGQWFWDTLPGSDSWVEYVNWWVVLSDRECSPRSRRCLSESEKIPNWRDMMELKNRTIIQQGKTVKDPSSFCAWSRSNEAFSKQGKTKQIMVLSVCKLACNLLFVPSWKLPGPVNRVAGSHYQRDARRTGK